MTTGALACFFLGDNRKVKHKMNIRKVLQNDDTLRKSFVLGCFCIICFVFDYINEKYGIMYSLFDMSFLHNKNINNPSIEKILFFSIFLTIDIIISLKRLNYIKSFEDNCSIIDAEIIKIYIRNKTGKESISSWLKYGRINIYVNYSFEANTYEKHFKLNKNKQTESFQLNTKIQVLVNNNVPNNSLIKQLYFD